jgi:hypothetical protein
MGVPFFSYEQGSPADLSWQAILRAFFEDPWAGATVVTANSASAVPIRIVRFILGSLLQFFSKFRTVFSVAVQTRRREYQSQIRSTTTAGVTERGREFEYELIDTGVFDDDRVV